MSWTRRKITATVSSGIVVAALATTVGLVLTSPAAPPRPAHSSPSPTPTPSPSPTQLLSPFTGEPVKSLGRVLAVKIDNIVYARPQTGITDADLVYVLPVEGGLTRFLAVFSSHVPPVIGPVRSAREDDLQLLRQFGRPAFAFSGAQPQLLPVVEHARIVNLYAGVAGGYYRDYSRIAPYNLYARTRTLLAEAKGASTARNIGFRFGAAPPGGRPVPAQTVRYPAASFGFTWAPKAGRWLVSMDGQKAMTTAGVRMSAPTVVIQHTIVRTSRFIEWGRRRPPYAETVGSGMATVLRNGRAYQVRWSRPAANGGTTFTQANGKPMPFAPGPVWILLTGNPVNESA